MKSILNLTKTKSINTLVISDLHEPFTHKDYLKHCVSIRDKYKCKRIVFIGDIADSHASNYWEHNPDGLSAGNELTNVKLKLKKWQEAFKREDVYAIIGNHDLVPSRKLFTAGIPNNWMRSIAETYETPNWQYSTDWTFGNVLYIHGQGSNNVIQTVINNQMNIVQGHFHTKFEIQYNASPKNLLWGMNVGCGIDSKAYAFEYSKFNIKKQILGCGVVLEDRIPILEPMYLN